MPGLEQQERDREAAHALRDVGEREEQRDRRQQRREQHEHEREAVDADGVGDSEGGIQGTFSPNWKPAAGTNRVQSGIETRKSSVAIASARLRAAFAADAGKKATRTAPTAGRKTTVESRWLWRQVHQKPPITISISATTPRRNVSA